MNKLFIVVLILVLIFIGAHFYLQSKVDPPAIVIGKYLKATTKVGVFVINKEIDFGDLPKENTKELFSSESKAMKAAFLLINPIYIGKEYRIIKEDTNGRRASVEVEVITKARIPEFDNVKLFFSLEKDSFNPYGRWLITDARAEGKDKATTILGYED